jgi:type II secretory pathway component PulM
MEDQQLGRLLREIPRERAGDGFTARVLERLDAPATGRNLRQRHWLLATAALFALVVSVAVLDRPQRPPREVRDARQALVNIRNEHERIQQELHRLQQMHRQDSAEPEVVDLGRVREGPAPVAYDETF